MGLIKVQNTFINQDNYAYPDPEIIIQTTRNPNNVSFLGTGAAKNENGYIYFYVDSLWKSSPFAYIGESKNSLQTRHNSTHKNSQWFKVIEYPFIGIINSPNKPWDTDTRRAIESLTIHKLYSIGIEMINSANSTWVNGGTIHPNVNNHYVEAIANIIVEYITHHIGYYVTQTPELVVTEPTKKNKASGVTKTVAVLAGKNTNPTDNRGNAGGSNNDVNSVNVSGSSNSDTSTRTPKYNPTKLKDLIESGTLAPQTIYSTERKYPAEAKITNEGEIIFKGNTYQSLSTAGRAARMLVRPNATNPNGWDFWATKQPDGTYKKLSQWRDEHDKLNNQV